MVFRVKYLDKYVLQEDIDRYNEAIKTTHSSRVISPLDRNWNHYFQISKDIKSDIYSIKYFEENSNVVAKVLTYDSIVSTAQILIEVCGELFFVDLFHMKQIWPNHFKENRSLLENLDSVIKEPKLYNEYLYSWDSLIDRIHILDLKGHESWLEINKTLNRDRKIDQLLN